MTRKHPDDVRLLERELTGEIIGAFYTCYNELGFGFLESVYRHALATELRSRNLRVIEEYPIGVYYRGVVAGWFRLDLVVNVGEMFQLVTRGYFKATVHRVVSPPPGTERISVAYFFNPKLEATLAPIDLPPELAAEAHGGESADPANPILANYGENSLKVRLRAHPDVAAIHHADLL